MPRHVYLFSGASAVGKTSALKALLPLLEEGGTAPCVCKIDCLKTGDGALFQRMGLPCVTGLSGDICPDHCLVPAGKNGHRLHTSASSKLILPTTPCWNALPTRCSPTQ